MDRSRTRHSREVEEGEGRSAFFRSPTSRDYTRPSRALVPPWVLLVLLLPLPLLAAAARHVDVLRLAVELGVDALTMVVAMVTVLRGVVVCGVQAVHRRRSPCTCSLNVTNHQ
jgi:hypothetical protein